MGLLRPVTPERLSTLEKGVKLLFSCQDSAGKRILYEGILEAEPDRDSHIVLVRELESHERLGVLKTDVIGFFEVEPGQ